MGGTRPSGKSTDEPGYRASGWPPADPDGETVDMDPGEAQSTVGAYLRWRERKTAPLLLRVPRANAVVLLALLAGVVALAYWVGQQRGQDSAKQEITQAQQQHRQLSRRFEQAPPATDEVVVNPVEIKQLPQSGTLATLPEPVIEKASKATEPRRAAGDRREVGLNYYIVARFPPAAAEQARQFLAGQGVETFVRPEDNGRFCEVIALRGFERIDSTAKAYESQLDRLGRLWKKRDGVTDDFDPYPRKYKGN